MSATVHSFPGNEAEAQRLAAALECALQPIAVRHFPDGESLVRVGETEATALLYCSLNDPNAKIVELLLAASALRDRGARQVVLIAPYLGYMRQDCAFTPGEAVSQRVVGGVLASAFDGLVTVDPHLHRTDRLEQVLPGIVAVNVSAAATIIEAIASRITPATVLVGPDEESFPWVSAIAAPLRLDIMIARKVRLGDRAVEIVLPDASLIAGRPAMLVDDLISSGGTLIACARQLRAAGAASIAAVVTHCLANKADLDSLAASGIAPVLATDTVPGPASNITMAAALAGAIRQHGLA